MNFSNLLLLISAFQGLVLALYILFSPIFKSKANNYLAYTIGIISLLMFNLFLDNIGVFETYPKLSIITYIEWAFLFPVFFLFYILKLTSNDLRNNKKLKWLYLPMILSIAIHVIIHLEFVFELYQITFKGKVFLYDVVIGLEQIGIYIFIAAIFIWSRIILYKASKSSDVVNVIWLKKLWLVLFIIVLSWILLFIVDITIYENYPELGPYIQFYEYILDIQLSLLVYWIAYVGLYKLRIANERKEILSLLNKKSISAIKNKDLHKNKKLDVSNDFLENNAYFLKLEQLLQEQSIYRDPNLSRETVAEKLEISTGYLSQIINKITQKNFTAYINSFRVEETKRMILDKKFDKYSLLSIGLESGFNSKTTFYSAFKKEAGCTPSEFKKQHK